MSRHAEQLFPTYLTEPPILVDLLALAMFFLNVFLFILTSYVLRASVLDIYCKLEIIHTSRSIVPCASFHL